MRGLKQELFAWTVRDLGFSLFREGLGSRYIMGSALNSVSHTTYPPHPPASPHNLIASL